jgi:glycosyltransferase involved in cell wall biosynthesis
MRILIDLQAIQEDGLESLHSTTSLFFIRALLRELGGHDATVVLSDRYPETIEPVRSFLDGILSQESICLWTAPSGGADQWPEEIVRHIRENVIAGFRPDFIYFAGNPSSRSVLEVTAMSCLLLSIPFGIERPILPEASFHESLPLNPSLFIDLPSQGNVFNGEHTAETLRAIESCSCSGRGAAESMTAAGRTLRLACVSPLPPEPSGISSYTAELLPYLSQYYSIDVIVDQKNVSDGLSVNESTAVRSVQWFRENHQVYDRILYHFGNSPFHKHMFALLEEIPGTVVLHDFYLSGIVGYLEDKNHIRGMLSKELLHGHGYGALARLLKGEDRSVIVRDYPCSHLVFRNADGVIVHSRHAYDLARKWYGPQIDGHICIIPHFRAPATVSGRTEARKLLGIDPDAFVVSTFGHINQNKLGRDLLDAWFSSTLSHDSACLLVYIGENDSGMYGQDLGAAISSSDRVRITGWVDDKMYSLWLQASDAAVQLRRDSRGESSGAVLDCMSHGLPVIVNAHGSMAEFPEDTVMMLSESCPRYELVKALETLRKDVGVRSIIGDHAREYIHRMHGPRDVATAYADAIETFHAGMNFCCQKVIDSITSDESLYTDSRCFKSLASALAESFPSPLRQKQLLVDVSALVQTDLKTGIQRVVRSIVKNLIDFPPSGYRIEPVYATPEQSYRYARQRTIEWLGSNSPVQFKDEEFIDIHTGDILFIPDLHFGVVVRHRPTYQRIRQKGARIVFLVHDILPVLMPHYFPEGTKSTFEDYLDVISTSADAVIGVSRTTALDFERWVTEHKPARYRPLAIGWNHHGADIDSSIPTKGLPEGFNEQLKELTSRPTFLMVGTVEPRKGHRQSLRAAELLWRNTLDFNLVIVGKHGWMVDDLATELNSHPERGHRLFWYQGISDEALLRIYRLADCVLMASEGEGFGLPVIEAAQHQSPILVRDIPVFREIVGEHATYFSGNDAESLAMAMSDWLANRRKGIVLKPDRLGWLSWQESTQQLLDMLADPDHPQWIGVWPAGK